MYPGRGVCGSASLGETVWTCVTDLARQGLWVELQTDMMRGPHEGDSTDEEYDGRY